MIPGMVKPTYKDYWDVPGGYAEKGESPRAACGRELHDELGLNMRVGRLLAVHFLFDGGVLRPDEHQHIELQRTELHEYRYVPVAEIATLTIDRLARRLARAYEARMHEDFVYLEKGGSNRPG